MLRCHRSTTMLLLIMAACAPQETGLSDADRARITDEITARVHGWLDAAAAGNEEATFGYYSSTSMDVRMPSEGQLYTPEEFRPIWQRAMSNYSAQVFDGREIVVHVLSTDIAVSTTGVASYSVVSNAGIASATVPYAQTVVWVRENDQWKAVTTHQSVRGGWPQPQ